MRQLFLFVLIVISITARSQQKDSTRILKEITIRSYESDRPLLEVPASVGLVVASDLSRFSNASLVSAVNTLPGIRMEERSPGSYRFAIRGSSLRAPFGVRNVKVYWNELPVTDPGGNTYLNQFDPNSIDQMEIIKGPGSSLYGAGTGGVVLLKSPRPQSENKISGSYMGGSFGLSNYQMALHKGSAQSSHYVGYQHQESDGYREQTRMVRDQLNSTFKFSLDDDEELEAAIFYSDLFYETPGGLTLTEFESDPRQSRPAAGTQPSAASQNANVTLKSFYTGVSHQYHFTDRLSNRTGVYGNFVQFNNPSIRNYERRSEQNFGARSVSNFTFNLGTLEARVVGGGEFSKGFSPIRTYSNNQGVPGQLQSEVEIKSIQYNLFGQGELAFGKWIMTGGLSVNWSGYEIVDLTNLPVAEAKVNYDPILTPRLAVLRKINDAFSLHSNVSFGFSPPTLAEVRPSTGIFNTDLKAEKGLQYELGARGYFANRKIFIDATLYHFAMDETIVVRRAADGADYFVNAGATDQNGLELQLQWHPSLASNTFSDFKFWTGLTLNNHEFIDYAKGTDFYGGNALTGVPDKILTGGLDVEFSKKVYLHITYNYTSSLPLDDANSVFAESYQLLGSKLGYKATIGSNLPVEIFVGGDNLLDQSYSLGNDLNAFGGRYFNAAAGRNYFAGVRFNLELKRV